jgi:hypothetical protein
MFNVPSFFGFKAGDLKPTFKFTIDTTATGISGSNQFKLPLTTSVGLDCVVNWGDGNTDNITSHTQPEVTHTYSSSGIYTIRITGSILGWRFANSGDRLKMLDVKQWNGLNISVDNAFRGCSSLSASAVDAPVITTTSLKSTFEACQVFNGAIGNWDISTVTNLNEMLRGCVVFDQDISNWDINQVSDFGGFMVLATGLSTTNYDLVLVGWEANLQALYPNGVGYPFPNTININFGGSQYTLGSAAATARQSLIDNFTWAITDSGGI